MLELKPEIDLELFQQLDLRVGEIIAVDIIEGSDKLLKITLNLGNNTHKIAFAGIKNYYNIDELLHKKVVVLCNLKPRKMRFGISEVMLLAASDQEKQTVRLIQPDQNAEPGFSVS